MSVKSDMKRVFDVGSKWTRVHHQNVSHVGGEIIEKGQPVKLFVIASDKEGIVFQLPTGEHSWLSWPQSTWIDATFTPNKVTLSNKYGPLLTYTRDTGVAEALANAILEGDVEDFMRGFRKRHALIPGTFFVSSMPRESWEVDYTGRVVKEIIGSGAKPAELHDISGFDLEDYFQRHGGYPKRESSIPLNTIAWYGPSGEKQRYPAVTTGEPKDIWV